MKLTNYAIGMFSAVVLSACAQEGSNADNAAETPAAEEATLDSLDKRFSYVMGTRIGTQMRMQNEELEGIDLDTLILGLTDAFNDGETLLTDQEMQETLMEFQQAQQEKMNAASDANKAAGEAFLAANAEKEGVVVLDSGLQYKVLTEGSGSKPAAENTVTVHYRGTLIDGTEFDSSYERNAPASFPLNGVIPGWTEGVQLMAEGAKYEFYIPSDLAYGPNGRPPSIGPNSTLVFEVELLKANANDGAEQ